MKFRENMPSGNFRIRCMEPMSYKQALSDPIGRNGRKQWKENGVNADILFFLKLEAL